MMLVLLSVCFGALLAVAAQQEWVGTWRGHQIVLRNYLTKEELYIDGELIDRKRSALSFSSRLTATVSDAGRTVPVLATIHPSGFGYMRIDAQLFVNGESVALQRVPLGTFETDSTAAVTEEPHDSRWSAVQMLLSDMRSRSSDIVPIINQAEGQLREVLNSIAQLSDQLEAHRELDSASGESGATGLLAIREEREEEARALLAAIQKLHLSTLQGQNIDSSDALNDLRSRLEAEVEVRSNDPTAHARHAATQKQL